MPAGLPYFAWIDPTETTFTSAHLRWDESVFSFSLKQSEGDPASLTLVVRRPRNLSGNPIGLLGPGRKIWCWFALDCDGTNLMKFRGRLVGVPTSLFEDLVTLEFVARPLDIVAQKAALADTLRVLPFYDPVVIDPSRLNDPEVVLEGYSAIWHYDRETLALSVSDEITGEDGLLNFDGTSEAATVFWDGLSLNLATGPLARVDVSAEYTWTQSATGSASGIDLTKYLTENWPNEPNDFLTAGVVTSFTLDASSWPKPGSGIGNGWTVATSTAVDVYDTSSPRTETGSNQITIQWWDGDTTNMQTSWSQSQLKEKPPLSIDYPSITTHWSTQFTYADDAPDAWGGGTYVSSYNSSLSTVNSVLPLHYAKVALTVGFSAARPCTEQVTFSLYADVQPILTDPDDGEALTINDVRSVDLSQAIDGVIPISDPARRSYIATARGNQSLEHLIALARANLLKRARVVEIAFAPKLERMPEVTLRKNVFLAEPRVGEATGKIIGYSVALDGSDGVIKCAITIGCAIGRGGSQVLTEGTPTYCTVDYTGADYQQFTDRFIAFAGSDTMVGYQPPNSNPNDDGLDLLSSLRAEDIIDIPLAVENPPALQREKLLAAYPHGTLATVLPTQAELTANPQIWDDAQQALVQARAKAVSDVLQQWPTKATFKLKSMTRGFTSAYPVGVTDLKVPTGYNLEAV